MPATSSTKTSLRYLSDPLEGRKKLGRKSQDEASCSIVEAPSSSRIKTPRACLYCKRSHMTCENQRPCWRCIKRGIADKCTGNETWQGESSASVQPEQINTTRITPNTPSASSSPSTSLSSTTSTTSQAPFVKGGQRTSSTTPTHLDNAAPRVALPMSVEENLEFAHLRHDHDHPLSSLAYFFPTPMQGTGNEASPNQTAAYDNHHDINFAQSNWAMFADITSSSAWNASHLSGTMTEIDVATENGSSMTMMTRVADGAEANNCGASTSTSIAATTSLLPLPRGRPYEHLLPSSTSEEEELKDIDNLPLRPYDYSYSFRRAKRWSRSHARWSSPSIARVDKVLQLMQTTWEALSADLSDIQLVQQERAFLDIVSYYHKFVLDAVSLPMCLIRRVGEIYCVNAAWASTMGVPRDIFENGRVCLYQLLDEDISVRLFEAVGKRLTGEEKTASFTESGKLSNTGEIIPKSQSTAFKQVQVTFELVNDRNNVPLLIIAMIVPLA